MPGFTTQSVWSQSWWIGTIGMDDTGGDSIHDEPQPPPGVDDTQVIPRLQIPEGGTNIPRVPYPAKPLPGTVPGYGPDGQPTPSFGPWYDVPEYGPFPQPPPPSYWWTPGPAIMPRFPHSFGPGFMPPGGQFVPVPPSSGGFIPLPGRPGTMQPGDWGDPPPNWPGSWPPMQWVPNDHPTPPPPPPPPPDPWFWLPYMPNPFDWLPYLFGPIMPPPVDLPTPTRPRPHTPMTGPGGMPIGPGIRPGDAFWWLWDNVVPGAPPPDTMPDTSPTVPVVPPPWVVPDW